ncbi:phage major capsid protein HK97 [Acetobacter orientalis]|uniref:Phage major capsid protein HK97 n=1 Tax=Acetobacter orientalis TaxID=146474 RepID=A0A2Z5ZID5_9PROT|nr:phage major capsid protein HK97 [Acetobacter orientalis]
MLQVPSVLAGVRILTEDIAGLPIQIKKRSSKGGWELDTEHRLNGVFRKPNPRETKNPFIKNMITNYLMNGSAYSVIARKGGLPCQLIGLARQARPRIPNDPATTDLFYEVYSPYFGSLDIGVGKSRGSKARSRLVSEADLIKLTGIKILSDSEEYLSPLTACSEVVTLAAAIQYAQGLMFRNGVAAQGIITSKKSMQPDQIDMYQANLTKMLSGVQNTGGFAFMAGEFDIHEFTGSKPIDMDYTNITELLGRQTFRTLRIPLHKGGFEDKDAAATVEEQNIRYVNESIKSMTNPLEEQFNDKLLMESERDTYRIEFNYDSMFTPSRKDQFDMFQTGINSSIINPNEARDELGMPGIGEEGELFTRPLNTGTLGDNSAVSQLPMTQTSSNEKQDTKTKSTTRKARAK